MLGWHSCQICYPLEIVIIIIISFGSKLRISQLMTHQIRRSNPFPMIRTPEITIQSFKGKECYLHQFYQFMISLDGYSCKEKVKQCIFKRQSFLKFRKQCIKINLVEIHETTTYYCFIKYQGQLFM